MQLLCLSSMCQWLCEILCYEVVTTSWILFRILPGFRVVISFCAWSQTRKTIRWWNSIVLYEFTLRILDASWQNNDLATQFHAPVHLNDYKYSTGNLEVVEGTGSSVYWLTTMNIDKERHGFPIHVLYSPIYMGVLVFPVNVLHYTHKSIFFCSIIVYIHLWQPCILHT